MQTQTQEVTAHNLYNLYSSLSDEVQQYFLQELLENQHDRLEDLAFYKGCKKVKDEDDYLNAAEADAFINSLS